MVDLAVPPEIESGPPRILFAILGAALSAVAGAIFLYFFRSRQRANG